MSCNVCVSVGRRKPAKAASDRSKQTAGSSKFSDGTHTKSHSFDNIHKLYEAKDYNHHPNPRHSGGMNRIMFEFKLRE